MGLATLFAVPAHAADQIPPAPEDVTAAKAYAVLDQHCARCHQAGKISNPATAGRPSAGLGNILHLDEIALDSSLVRPGNPDGSNLYTTLLMRIAAHDNDPLSAPAQKSDDLSSTDLDSLRTWIKFLPIENTCQMTTSPSMELDTRAALAALGQLSPEKAKMQRFMTLTGLLQTCPSDAELAIHREALGRTVNGLSWGLDPIAVSPVNENRTLFQIDLSSIGWTAARWERMMASYPFQYAHPDMSNLVAATGSASPIVRGDWMTVHALQAPLYYELLGLPDRLPSLLASLKINLAADVAAGKAQRYGTKTSVVSRGARLVQRHEFANGPAWITFEYAPTVGRQDVFDVPSGPVESGTQSRNAPKPDASLMHFALPSGFTAFYMANTDGQRINDIATSILKDESHPTTRLGTASSCFGCHATGARGGDDQLRARLAAETQLPKDQHDKLMALHSSPEILQSTVASDQDTLAKAMRSAKLLPGVTHHGLDPISMQTKRYERGVTRAEVADLLNRSLSSLTELEDAAKGQALDVLQRLRQGPVARRDVMAHLPELYALLPSNDTAAQSTRIGLPPPPLPQSRPDVIDVVLKSSKSTYRTGDILTVFARASSNCNMTIVNVDAAGRGTVIFPNDFEQNNAVEAGVELRLPAETAPYQFRLKEKGRETIVAVCNATQKTADAIVHDFEKQRFTELGDYRAFLTRVFASDPDEKKAAAKTTDPRSRRTRRGRTESAPPKEDRPVDPRDVQGRAAIQIEIH
jgi:mono/diheme cytochrome c family protein